MDNTGSPLAVLKTRFGYDSFRPLQADIIGNVLARRDSLVLMPTGGGKSLCYQLPALVFDGLTLVISPLIALMKDQVDALNANGIAARFINSSLPASEIERVQGQVLRREVKILYAAPERLALPGFRHFLHNLDLDLIAIDEAHCISEWGHDFRPDYRNLKLLREEFPAVPVIALTATATEQVRQDIIGQLGLQQGQVFLSSFNRSNLSYSVQPKSDSWRLLLTLLRKRPNQSTIIYCFSRRDTEDLAEDLNQQGLPARPYHAGLDGETRRRTQEDFIRDRVPIIVATIAFGMGIDKPDIRLVVHYSLPKSLEGYYQETGRAGRDGVPSDCVLFFTYADKAKQDYFINQIEAEAEQRNARQKLAKMVDYAQLPTCRRRFLLEYFGEQWPEESCNGCDVCLNSAEEFDAGTISQMILSAVIRTGERFGANHVIQVLVGSREKRILELGHDQLSVYGIAKDFARPQLREIIGHLQAKGLLARNEGEYPTLAVTPGGREFLRRRETLTLPRPSDAGVDGEREAKSGRPGSPATLTASNEVDEKLFQELRMLRRMLAEDRDVPPFVVFGDASLRHMAAAVPQTTEEFSRIHGVGEAKLAQYGPDFLTVIRNFAKVNGLPVHTLTDPKQEQEQAPSPPAVGTGGQDRSARRSATADETLSLMSQKWSVDQIAQQRGLAETTIIGHLERLAAQDAILDLEHLMPSAEKLSQIEEAFNAVGGAFLKPVREFLGAEFTYDQLRLARIHLRQQGRLSDA